MSLNHLLKLLSIRYKVAYKKDSGECRLEISMTFADDAGEYSVFAKNQLGEVSASVSLLEEGTLSFRVRDALQTLDNSGAEVSMDVF